MNSKILLIECNAQDQRIHSFFLKYFTQGLDHQSLLPIPVVAAESSNETSKLNLVFPISLRVVGVLQHIRYASTHYILLVRKQNYFSKKYIYVCIEALRYPSFSGYILI
ncbi:hypothetical protein ACJX0J_012569 [Zea mays]